MIDLPSLSCFLQSIDTDPNEIYGQTLWIYGQTLCVCTGSGSSVTGYCTAVTSCGPAIPCYCTALTRYGPSVTQWLLHCLVQALL